MFSAFCNWSYHGGSKIHLTVDLVNVWNSDLLKESIRTKGNPNTDLDFLTEIELLSKLHHRRELYFSWLLLRIPMKTCLHTISTVIEEQFSVDNRYPWRGSCVPLNRRVQKSLCNNKELIWNPQHLAAILRSPSDFIPGFKNTTNDYTHCRILNEMNSSINA